MMPSAELIVCEATSKWAVALRRHLRLAGDARVSETRLLEDCWRQATSNPCSFIALEGTAASVEHVVVALQQYRARRPRVRVAVLADRSLTEAEWLLREAGAVYVVFSSRRLAPLVRLIRRHFDRVGMMPSRVSPARWEQLPWGAAGDTVSVSRPGWLHE
jgi:hypothetical protein